ncbi:unnamed protein product (macronuclear) [Paramecium tetraurelia]|uniref:Pyridoxal 5'-phosphate synthase n=1 Tax=Paramecium tetraurelia TaxID=5888 RepID=A0BP68_PARTE|nr:uncharacterized protein GSPATT00005084001 [Paramecium tetraurelia]CAK60335.1 unnamed protein product [Paramecium tetraurelia]|eukprot:XP_001427733.1 hypothetical protein (macronuclear) [Paramecium tetraurelia strain d4-2]
MNANLLQWEQQIEKSRLSNQQLDFCQYFTLSYIYENEPESFLGRCRLIQNGNIYIYLDRRSKNYKQLSQNVSLLWHFPLSKEIYQIKAQQNSLIENIENHWSLIDKEEKKNFHTKFPDQVLDQIAEKQLTDIEKFNMQDKNNLSENFKVIKISPFDIIQTKQTMPQVIADSRTKFESIFRPYKEEQKIHYYFKENQWFSNQII